MPQTNAAPARPRTDATIADVLIVGAGALGLNAAVALARQHLRVVICDRADPTADVTAASATPLGALMPHMPDRWNAKKQFQYDALVTLQAHAAQLAGATGIDPEYARCGRLVPIRTEQFAATAVSRCADSAKSWQLSPGLQDDPGAQFCMDVAPAGEADGWLDEAASPLGALRDPLAARINARAYRCALAAQCAAMPNVTTAFGHDLASLDHATRRASLKPVNGASSREVAYHIVLLAAGYTGFEVLEQHFAVRLGFGVHGEAAVLALPQDPARAFQAAPIIYDDGVYVVAHGAGRVAVGATSSKQFKAPNEVAPSVPEFVARARQLCPPLRSARVVERWAGVRPKCIVREPVAGLWPETPGLAVLMGGFKITLGVAHHLARACTAGMMGELNDPALATLPPTWRPSHHLAQLAERGSAG